MGGLLGILAKVLGFSSGGSVINTVSGVVNHAALIPALIYLSTHADEQIHLSVSYGFLALIGGFGYVLIEMNRRSNPAMSQ